MQRKTQEQIDLEAAAGQISDYDIFMAVANHIGHDKEDRIPTSGMPKVMNSFARSKSKFGNMRTAFGS